MDKNELIYFLATTEKLGKVDIKTLLLLSTKPYSQVEIAKVTGLPRQNINRSFKALIKLGLIKFYMALGSSKLYEINYDFDLKSYSRSEEFEGQLNLFE